jgi:hypothetical protein
MTNTVQLTINLPQADLAQLLRYAKENELSLDAQIADLIEDHTADFRQLSKRIELLECLVHALQHELRDGESRNRRIPVKALLEKGVREMTAEDVAAIHQAEDSAESRRQRRVVENAFTPLISDTRVIAGALEGRTIQHVSAVVDGHGDDRRVIGLWISTTEGIEIVMSAVALAYDDYEGFGQALEAAAKTDRSSRLVWNVMLPSGKRQETGG